MLCLLKKFENTELIKLDEVAITFLDDGPGLVYESSDGISLPFTKTSVHLVNYFLKKYFFQTIIFIYRIFLIKLKFESKNI